MHDLQKLATNLGISSEYINSANVNEQISPDARIHTLRSLGYDIDNQENLSKQLLHEKKQNLENILPPVLVLRDNDKHVCICNVADCIDENFTLEYKISCEDGDVIENSQALYELEIADYESFEDKTYDFRRLYLPVHLPYGYHKLNVFIKDANNKIIKKSKECSLIVTPLCCYRPQALEGNQKLWGVSVQLYALRSNENWGIGDFHDLKDLLVYIHNCGGSFVGLNPLHALFPANPDPDMVSPYSPSSRNYLNIAYIRVEDVKDFLNSKEACEYVHTAAFSKKIKALQNRDYVDYKQVIDLKLKVLRMVFDSSKILDKRTKRSQEFDKFLKEQGDDLFNMATFDAIQANLYNQGINATGATQFPKEFSNLMQPFVKAYAKEHINDVYFYCYLQFVAFEQLHEAYSVAKNYNMPIGIYRDLAVGVSPNASDVWADLDNVYVKKASIGAPPDLLGPQGQDWGLCPMDPKGLKQSAYRTFIKLCQSNMKDCGALRIDHAAGLYRSWYVPHGHKATDGAYVQNNYHDLLGIIALESHRNKCLIIGEDLGTIPMQLREALAQAQIYSYKLFFAERNYDGSFINVKNYYQNALCALCTHDMPTLKGWWNMSDLTLGMELGVYQQVYSDKLKEDRQRAKQEVLNTLHQNTNFANDLPTDACGSNMDEPLVKALQVYMCQGSSALYASQIEDWIGVLKPVNIPGTFREYPNWRRKLPDNLDKIFNNSFVKELTLAMSKSRLES